ncbi:hypothetical protein Efla_004293 [Eimeria flavescens]
MKTKMQVLPHGSAGESISRDLTYASTSWLKEDHKGEGISCWGVTLCGILTRVCRGYSDGRLCFLGKSAKVVGDYIVLA